MVTVKSRVRSAAVTVPPAAKVLEENAREWPCRQVLGLLGF